MQDKTVVSIAGILAIAGIEGCALLCGIDGIVLTASVGAICSIIGYAYGIVKCTPKTN